jgi:hypothetical protein
MPDDTTEALRSINRHVRAIYNKLDRLELWLLALLIVEILRGINHC